MLRSAYGIERVKTNKTSMIVDGDKFIRAINLLPCSILSAVTTKKHYRNSLGFSLMNQRVMVKEQLEILSRGGLGYINQLAHVVVV